ncbi:MAG: hypothetical protein AA931_01795 [Peptococcaceae bacterium 1109]|jgi:stage III sporulation protein AF|nr:MAG: hypothetical protein AA931_01795 [Peptococcaceae bacterium 1109]
MEQLRSWLKTVTGLVIILGVLETLLPDAGGVKGFAKLVFGLALMAAILQPVLALVSLDWAVVAPPETGVGQDNWLATAERLQAKGAAPLLAAVEDSAARQLQSLLLTVDGVEEALVELTPGSGQMEEATVVVQGSGEIAPRIRRIAAYYLDIPESKVKVRITSKGEPGE